MYKVVIVEDETPIRNIIARIINWEQLGFELVFQADNGQIAFSYIEEHPVDLVITDISMPFMDGLELCKQIRRIHQSMTIVILTGYNEFEYAQQAIELNVSNYLLKPLTKDSFMETLMKIKREMDEAFAKQRNLDFLRNQYEKNKEFLKNKYLMNLILGYSHTTLTVKEEELGIDLNADSYRVGVMVIDDDNESEEEFWGADRPLLEFAIFNLMEEYLENMGQKIVFWGPGSQVCIIFKNENTPEDEFLNHLVIHLNDLSEQIKKFFQLEATIGLSDSYKEVSDLCFGYRDSLTALEYKVLEGNDRVIIKANVENKSSFAFQKVDEQLAKLAYSIKVGDLEQLNRVISYIFSLIHYESIDIDDFRTMLLKMTMTIFESYNDIRKGDGQKSHKGKSELDYAIFTKVFELKDFGEIKEFYLDLCRSMSGKIKDLRMEDDESYINTAIKHIEDHYSDPYLSLEGLCKQLYLSPGHFSRLFKKTIGMTFVDYLTKVRMDHAKILLANTNQKMYEISNAIGYEDPNYFSYNFKKHVQYTPSEWRKKGQGI